MTCQQAPYAQAPSSDSDPEGRPAVVLLDDHVRGSAMGLLVCPAPHVDVDVMRFVVKHTSGFVCVALPPATCDRLDLRPMAGQGWTHGTLQYTVTVDAAAGITTGISARDRARTIRLLGDPTTTDTDLNRPGHVVPVRVEDGAAGRATAAVAALSWCRETAGAAAAMYAPIVSLRDPRFMAGVAESCAFAERHGLSRVSARRILGLTAAS